MVTTAKRRGAVSGSMMIPLFIVLLLNNLSQDDFRVRGSVAAIMIRPVDEHPAASRQGILSSDHSFCGIGFQDASNSCQYPCPSGSLDECPHGMLCYFNTPCDIKNLGPRPTHAPTHAPKLPTVSPLSSDDPTLSFFCGNDWSDASNNCAIWCPNADDGMCPYGQSCFGDTTCKKTNEPTNIPTKPPPTISPSNKPTGPTGAPSVGLMEDQPSNHQFCGYEYNQAINECSIETHCPNGAGDCPFPQSCWIGLTDCDVRDFTPFELGGFLNKPTQQQLAEGMGLSYPSDDPTDHFFCGLLLEDINKKCNTKPCPDGTATTCDFGQACFQNTVCDARIRPEYGVTKSPTIQPTPSPLTNDAREYFSFCGEDWAQANTCKMQWCGNGSQCPNGQSCFADTECSMKDKLDGPPTMKPTEAPVTYMDDINFRFCGKTYLDAVAQCSVGSYCKSGKHDECPGGEYCWNGVSCNIKDMVQPTTSRPTIYRPPTRRPSRAPLPLDDPRNYRFCGKTWLDADSCSHGWCPNGSDEECPVGFVCWADTTCHAAEITLAPSKSPSLHATSIEGQVPSIPPIPYPYDDPMHTSFCGFSFDDASSYCSVESHCPSGLHQDCPTGQYCWAGTSCNILEFTPPFPLPSQYPSRKQSDTPSTFRPSPPFKSTMPQAAVSLTSSPVNRLSSQSPNPTATGVNFLDNGSSSSSPTNPIVVVVPAIHLQHTRSPTLYPTQSIKSVFLPPISKDPIPQSPNENIVRVQHIIESIEAALRSEIFVLVTNGGALIKSSLYTYEGFLSALLFYSNTGVNDNFFYLGGKKSSDEQSNLEVEFGIANVGLFIAKLVTDTIVYERCTPDLLACGFAALDTIFETQTLRFMCPPSSDIAGLDCDEHGVGCACTLGFLNQNIGLKSPDSSKYSGLNFCSSDHQSLCNRHISEGAELRWITAMTHWVLRVQRHEESGLIFIDELHKFVKGGMVDMSFLHAVADISVMDSNPISREALPTKQQFVDNFFKVMIRLSEGHSQSQPGAVPNTVMQKTAPPSTTSPLAAVPFLDTIKPTQTPQTIQLQSMEPSTSPSSLKATAPIDSPTKDPELASESETQPLCPTFCIEVTPVEKCPSRDDTVPFTVLYCSPATGMNEMCRGNGYCGTSESLNNCGKGRSIYRRIECSSPAQTNEASVINGGASNSPTASDTHCSLCRHEEMRIDADIIFNGNQSTCAVIQSFLHESFYAADATCVSAKNELSAACCVTKAVQVPFPAPVETIEPTKRGSDLPWYQKYSEGRSRSSGGRLSPSLFRTGVCTCLLLLSFIIEL